MITFVKFEQDVYSAYDKKRKRLSFVPKSGLGMKYHSKGDIHFCIDMYKADLDASGVKYKVMAQCTDEEFKDLCMRWRKAMEGLGYEWPCSNAPAAAMSKAWDIVRAQR